MHVHATSRILLLATLGVPLASAGSTTTLTTTTTAVTTITRYVSKVASPVPATTSISTSTDTTTSAMGATTITTTAITTSPPATAGIGASHPDQASFQAAVLNSTNYYRSRYEAAPLVWNTTLAAFALSHAQTCVFEHSGGPYGENLAAGYPTPALAVDAWGDEESSYNWAKHKFGEATGHFTQLVWQNTTSVGCGLVPCANDAANGAQGQYLVCEYSPRGNVVGEFKYNVAKAGVSDDGVPGFGGAASLRGGLGVEVVALVVGGLVWAALC